MAIQFNPDVTAPTTNATLTAMIGGTVANPKTPTQTTLATGLPRNFTCDAIARYFYFMDSGNNLLKWDASTPSVAPVQIVSSAGLGTTVNFMVVSPDGTTLYATTTANTVLSVLTSAPYTVATLATGFSSCKGIAYDTVNNLLRVWDTTAGGPSSVTLAGVVAAHSGLEGGMSYPVKMNSSSGTLYFPFTTNLYKVTPAFSIISIKNVPSSYMGALAVDDDSPAESNLYYFRVTTAGSDGVTLYRLNLSTMVELGIATTAAKVITGSETTPQMYFRNDSFDPLVNPALYVVDSAGNLLRFEV